MGKRVVVLAVLASCGVDDGVGSTEQALGSFVLPSLTAADRAAIVHRYDTLDPTDLVPRGLLEDAIVYFDVNQASIPKQHYVAIADFSRYSGKDRYWLVDLETGAVEAHKVAHGDGTDPDNNGYADTFGNTDGSHMTSLGFYLTGEIYDGTHVHSMRLDGLSPDHDPNGMANTNARPRLIVMHEASYVDDANPSQQGRSNGCLALDPSIEVAMVDRIHDGSLIYAATSSLSPPVGRAVCGDGTCDGAETIASCPADCTA
ncbi:MAG: murein L,D-transpeptidase catalytic domain-containing protein, partial [Kofleriaceae bacterium]